MKKILIVGTGISGASCARLLAQKNYKITIIDKNNFIGGNCYDYLSNDQSCYIHKFGPHIFHTLNKNIWNFVNRFSKFNTYHHCVYTKVNNEIYTFPINLNVISKLFNKNVYSEEDVNQLIHDKYFKNPKNFQEAAINAVGTKIYTSFIKNYTEKQWNMNAKNLPIQIFKRIDIRYNFNNDYFPNQYQGQPINGYTNLIKNILNHQNIKIILNQDFYNFNIKNFDYIIYTGGFNELPYRSIKFQHFIDQPNNFAVLNTPQDLLSTRITNFNILHGNRKFNNHHFCKQFPAKNNQFNELYPIRTKQNLIIYNYKILEMKNKYQNILFCGRLATYQYFDMDKAIEQVIELINKIF